jgi:predicted phage terminase large subunit-like protein
MYSEFKTYSELPKDGRGRLLFERIQAYCDSADTGDDYLCLIVYGVYLGIVYVLDVYYTGDSMETTEPKTAEILNKNEVNFALFESNGAGRGFARNVRRIMYSELKTRRTSFQWFHQSQNKEARIFTWSAWVTENILMPVDWKNRFPNFYDDVTSYTKEQQKQNERDDGPDALTGIAEEINKKIKPIIFETRV